MQGPKADEIKHKLKSLMGTRASQSVHKVPRPIVTPSQAKGLHPKSESKVQKVFNTLDQTYD